MGCEIERKFLVKDDSYKQMAFAAIPMMQGYICHHRGRTVRVRITGQRAELTIKGPSLDGGLSRYEFNHPIPVEDARELLQLCDRPLISKTRHLVRSGQHTFEVDEFFEENAGLVVAEVELGSVDEPFEKLPFVGEEVTGQRRYTNASLVDCPYCEWGDK